MGALVQWATILSPIISTIAVVVAVVAIYCNSKDTNKKISAIEKSTSEQIAAIEESTVKQIKSIKELTEIQIELSSIQLQKELNEARTSYLQVSQRTIDEMERDEAFRHIGGEFEIIRQRQDRRRDLVDEEELKKKYVDNLQGIQGKYNVLKKKFEENKNS